MKRFSSNHSLPTLVAVALLGLFLSQCKSETKKTAPEKTQAIQNDTNIQVPDGFSVQMVAQELGNLRHMTVSNNGDIYVNRSKLKDGKAIIALKDISQEGKVGETQTFGDLPGTGILFHKGFLYASSNSGIFRYKLDGDGEVIDTDKPEKIVDGLADHGRDNAKSFVMDDDSNIYVTIGSWNDSGREEGSGKAIVPSTILDSAGGIWTFEANKLNQTFSDGNRYATGIKNAVATAWNFNTNSLFAAVHGRGGFHDLFPQYYTAKNSAELPAETLYEIHENDDAGWPQVYYDHFKKAKILAPEFGGDGQKTGREDAIDPVMAFPAHLAPNDLLFYTGNMFPEKYKNGAFVAFHGQSPELKKGYFVAFVPFKNGKPSGDWEIFADNFAGIDLANPTGPVQHRPCGLAQGPDGELYVCDDLGGSIFKITH